MTPQDWFNVDPQDALAPDSPIESEDEWFFETDIEADERRLEKYVAEHDWLMRFADDGRDCEY